MACYIALRKPNEKSNLLVSKLAWNQLTKRVARAIETRSMRYIYPDANQATDCSNCIEFDREHRGVRVVKTNRPTERGLIIVILVPHYRCCSDCGYSSPTGNIRASQIGWLSFAISSSSPNSGAQYHAWIAFKHCARLLYRLALESNRVFWLWAWVSSGHL